MSFDFEDDAVDDPAIGDSGSVLHFFFGGESEVLLFSVTRPVTRMRYTFFETSELAKLNVGSWYNVKESPY